MRVKRLWKKKSEGKRIIWGLSGGVAIYKAIEVIRELMKLGYEIRVVMTWHARKFVGKVMFESITGNRVSSGLFEGGMQHIELVEGADILVIAPATANVIGQLANGLGSDLLSSLCLFGGGLGVRKMIAPAMNSYMYENLRVQENLRILRGDGYEIIGPDEGLLACGYEGKGRLKEGKELLRRILGVRNDGRFKGFKGKKVLVAVGGTVERIDAFRYIGNFSTGRMGIGLARGFQDLGGEVELVYSRIEEGLLPIGMKAEYAESARDLLRVLEGKLEGVDILVMASAVGDYRVLGGVGIEKKEKIEKIDKKEKMRKQERLFLDLEENVDILKELSKKKKEGQKLIGFAAETEDLERNARKKLESKGLDLVIGNDISKEGVGFGSLDNEVILIFSDGEVLFLGRMRKEELGRRIARKVLDKYGD